MNVSVRSEGTKLTCSQMLLDKDWNELESTWVHEQAEVEWGRGPGLKRERRSQDRSNSLAKEVVVSCGLRHIGHNISMNEKL
jgi:hypothetical protein